MNFPKRWNSIEPVLVTWWGRIERVLLIFAAIAFVAIEIYALWWTWDDPSMKTDLRWQFLVFFGASLSFLPYLGAKLLGWMGKGSVWIVKRFKNKDDYQINSEI